MEFTKIDIWERKILRKIFGGIRSPEEMWRRLLSEIEKKKQEMTMKKGRITK